MGKEDIKKDKTLIGSISWSQIFQFRSSTIPKIYIPVLVASIYNLLLCILYQYIKDKSFVSYIFFPTSIITYIGTVLSLLLTFRNNSAYDRYWEGRKIWDSIISHSRNASRHIWISFEIKEDDPEKEKKINLKVGALRLLVALVISIKHALRDEYRMENDGLGDLIKHLPLFRSYVEQKNGTLKYLPLKIVYFIDSVCYMYLTQKSIRLVCSPTSSIIEGYSSCQRILTTPIPIIYSIHFKHILILYFLSLPLQIVPSCGWISIIITMLTAYTFFGVEAISSEIENPFGSDENDLLLDEFCQQVKEEINDIMKTFPYSGYQENVNWLEYEKIVENGTSILDI